MSVKPAKVCNDEETDDEGPVHIVRARTARVEKADTKGHDDDMSGDDSHIMLVLYEIYIL